MKSLAHEESEDRSWLRVVREQIASLRFGVVQVIVHDGRVVQIERTEKVRLDSKPGANTDCETHFAHQSSGGIEE